MKANQFVEPSIDLEAHTITFLVRNKSPLTLHMDKVHEKNRERAAYVGFGQVRIVDAAAIGTVDKNGKVIPEIERQAIKYRRMQALIEHYESGTDQWGARVAGPVDKSTTILQALCNTRREDMETVSKRVTAFAAKAHAGDLKAALKYLAGDPKVAAEVVRIETLGAKVDADTMLSELE
jgi:hypothetical protein